MNSEISSNNIQNGNLGCFMIHQKYTFSKNENVMSYDFIYCGYRVLLYKIHTIVRKVLKAMNFII